jgi:hypothetical protein
MRALESARLLRGVVVAAAAFPWIYMTSEAWRLSRFVACYLWYFERP